MNRSHAWWVAGLLVVLCGPPSPAAAQLFPAMAKMRGLPRISMVKEGLPELAHPAYGEIMLSGNEALLEPAWLIGSLRDVATGQVLKWNNYLLPDAKPNVKLLTETIFEGFVDSAAIARAEWLSTLKMQIEDRAVAEVVVTRLSVTSIDPKQIDRARLWGEIVQRLPADQRDRYAVIIAYVDIAITATRFQHYEVDGDVAGYGGRIGGEWYYKDKQKSTDHRLVAISAPLPFALTAAFSPAAGEKMAAEFSPGEAEKVAQQKPFYELVREAIGRGELPPEQAGLASVLPCPEQLCPIASLNAGPAPGPQIDLENLDPILQPKPTIAARRRSPVAVDAAERLWATTTEPSADPSSPASPPTAASYPAERFAPESGRSIKADKGIQSFR